MTEYRLMARMLVRISPGYSNIPDVGYIIRNIKKILKTLLIKVYYFLTRYCSRSIVDANKTCMESVS